MSLIQEKDKDTISEQNQTRKLYRQHSIQRPWNVIKNFFISIINMSNGIFSVWSVRLWMENIP